MRKTIIILLSVLLVFLSACSSDEYRDGYEIAKYEKYNSYAKDNGLESTKISIQGTVKSVFDFNKITAMSIVSQERDRWLISLDDVEYSQELVELFDEEFVTVYGLYEGYSDILLMPVIFAERIVANGKEYRMNDFPSYTEATDIPTEIPTEIQPKSTTGAATEAPTEKPQIVLYDSNGVKITYKNTTHDLSSTKINLLIENNTDKDYCIQTRNMSVNGFMLEPVFSSDVTAGNKANDSFTFYNSSLKENEIAIISHLEFRFYIFSWDDRASAIETETISFDI